MKFLGFIVAVFIVYTNTFYASALPTDLTDALAKKVQLNREGSKSDNLPSAKYNPEYMGGHFEGDMILPTELLRGAASDYPWQRWPNGIIPYVFHSSISTTHRTLITNTMRQMESLLQVDGAPCIQFRERLVADQIYITIRNGSGCSAHVGYLEPYVLDRTVTLMYAPPYTCMTTGIIQHELIHVLGFYHEQSRTDRDDYVSIQWQNIAPGTEHNFAKYSDIDLLGTPYNYGSLMHYQNTAFSTNGLPTIVATQDTDEVMGQRVGMSDVDILEIQRYYGCVPWPEKK